ncbi:MAG: hypothetical protein PVI26_07050, partial [Chitinispirillia bacterium]
MKYLIILNSCFLFLCTNIVNPQKKTALKVSAGEDITVTKNDTIKLSGIFKSTADVEIFSWYIIGDTRRQIRANTQQ